MRSLGELEAVFDAPPPATNLEAAAKDLLRQVRSVR